MFTRRYIPSFSQTTTIALEREQEERKEVEAVVTSLKRQLASLNEKCAAIDAEIEEYRAITGNLQRGL